MREILFKGKRVDNGEWVEGSLLIDIDKKYVIIPSGKGVLSSFEVIPETVSQYTGLKDKNGNKIFENDIVINKGATEPEEKGFKVVFRNGRFRFDSIYSTNYRYSLNHEDLNLIPKYFEIITE